MKSVYVGGDRRTFYVPDMSMQQLLTELMNETLMPHLRNSNYHIEQMRRLLLEDSHPGRKVPRKRVGQHQRLAARGSQGPAGAAQDGGDRVRFV